MAHGTTGRLACQVNRVRRQIDETSGLSVARWLPAERIQRVLDEAVARLLADRVQRGLSACSADTGAYCTARKRLPEKVLQRLVEQTGQDFCDQQATLAVV